MPSTVNELFSAVGLTPSGVVSWGTAIPATTTDPTTGVYIVASQADPDSTRSATSTCPISPEAIATLLDVRQELTVDGTRPDVATLTERLASAWCSDEVVVYIGRAGPRKRVTISALSDRVQEYYGTSLGASGPHAGGWPIKTLATLGEASVHYCYCTEFERVESDLLDAFAGRVSDETRVSLHDQVHLMPFANLKNNIGNKSLGIKGARAPKKPRKRDTERAGRQSAPPRAPIGGSRTSQRVTAADLGKGQLRIPRTSKDVFPNQPADVTVVIRGTRKVCRWNPRLGPDQERSGVVGIGRDLMRRLVAEGEVLRITRRGEAFRLD